MTSKSDFRELAALIDAIDPKEIKQPSMPVGVYLQEAEDLHAWALADRDTLTAAGLDWPLVEGLPGRTGAARFAQSQWNSTRFSKEDAQQKFAALAPEAYDLRDRLVHHMLFAYRKNEDLKSRVQAIAEGSGDADMIQDLSDLAVHGRNNPEPLQAVHFDMDLLDEAATKADSSASLLGQARGEAATDQELKVDRDKAYTLLKQAVDEIREFGQYVFWRDPARKQGYASAHKRKMRGGSARKPAASAAPAATTVAS